MKRSIVLLALLTVACDSANRQQEIDERIAQLENGVLAGVQILGEPAQRSTITERLDFFEVPAVSIAVINDGEIEWAKAYGMADVAEGRAATPNTLFQAASISKPVAATAALTLVEEGKLTLDQDVNELLSSWQIPGNRHTASEHVSLRRLVTHSGGMTVHGFPGYSRQETIPTTVQVLEGEGNTAPIRVDTTPGSIWRYSGGGYTVMQLLVSDLTGQRFPDVLLERVLDPFQMALSTYEQPLPESRHSDAATAYRDGGAEVEFKWHVYPEMAAAGLWTTPTDLAKFALGVLDAYHGRSEEVITQSTAREMLTAGIGGHGLGPSIGSDGLYFGHGGANEGFRCQLYAFIESEDGVAVMTNSDNGGYLNREIVSTLAEIYDWPALKARARNVVDVAPELLGELEGRYSYEGEVVLQVEVVNGEIWLDVRGEDRHELLAESDSVFFTRDTGLEVRFLRTDGRTVALRAIGTRFERVR